jgi:GTP-binding nuclear protein Ran
MVEMASTIVLLGDGGVGKTSFINRLITGDFEERYIPSTIQGIGMHLYDSKNVLLVDTPGQSKYNKVFDTVCKDAKAFLIFFSVESKLSFNSCEEWIAKAKKGNPEAKIILVGTKVDITHRKVSEKNIQELQYKYDLNAFCISTKSNYNFDIPLNCATY